MTALEAAVILFTIFFAMDYVPKFGSLGTIKAEKVFNPQTMKSEFNDYDHSFMILLFSTLELSGCNTKESHIEENFYENSCNTNGQINKKYYFVVFKIFYHF